MDFSLFKRQLHEACLQSVQDKVDLCHASLKGFQDAANEETKSSAGDKYETGRAMMHLEKEKIASQLDQALKQQKVLRQINPDKVLNKVDLGTLVETNSGLFYISVSLGMLKLAKDVFCISPVSPLGKAMLGKSVGDQVSFNGRNYAISQIA